MNFDINIIFGYGLLIIYALLFIMLIACFWGDFKRGFFRILRGRE